MSGNEVDEAARNWPQLMALFFQLLQRIQRASADGSIRLSRTDYKQFVTELHDAQKMLNHEITTTRAWYQARTEDYQRESAAAKARAAAGSSPEEQARAAAYLSGLRASIEHTIHNTVLTPEQRGQVVQALDGIDNDPAKPVARNVFETLSGRAAVQARYAAAASEQKVAQHREQLTQTANATAQPANAEITKLRQENTRRFDDLATRLEVLEERINKLIPEQTANAKAASSHSSARNNHQARQQAEADPGNSAAQQAEAATQGDSAAQAEAEPEQPNGQRQTAAEQMYQAWHEAWATPEAEAQMQAEA
ncbi:hypothetical protein VMT65_07550 [Nocardia sp. CDC153]|uniref:hypothetical protein n=1 Tax=Nocardia sp. CDC153 TaxID=3112167 RepID=UPI002DB622EA|nr:hypothetical protein [Nocardia sp. CDC153]MEC3952880.1 hypothetical protein [Nocardia sp. CDC153]